MDNDWLKTEQLTQIRERLNKLWQMPDRPDLLDDCCEYVYDKYYVQDNSEDEIIDLLIKFLSHHATNGMSSQELEDMANDYQQDMFKQNEEYCEHCGDTLDKCTGYKCWIR
tara:strand:+ start:85 stop:417 length:333 start_codon:yes stop_codon:yes gene_type:complete